MLSVLSTKLMSLGALLVAYELKQMNVGVAVAHVESHGYVVDGSGMLLPYVGSRLCGLWLSGDAMNLDALFATIAPQPVVVGTGLLSLNVILDEDDFTRAPYLHAGGTCGNVMAILSYLGWCAFPAARLDGDPTALCVQRDWHTVGLLSTSAYGSAQVARRPSTSNAPGEVRRAFHRTSSCETALCAVGAFRATSRLRSRERRRQPSECRLQLSSSLIEYRLALLPLRASKERCIVFEPQSIGDRRALPRGGVAGACGQVFV